MMTAKMRMTIKRGDDDYDDNDEYYDDECKDDDIDNACDDDEIDDGIIRCESSLTTSLENGARLMLAPALSDGYNSHHHHHQHHICQCHHYHCHY